MPAPDARVRAGRSRDGDAAPSPRRPSPGWPPICGCSACSASGASPPSRPRSWPPLAGVNSAKLRKDLSFLGSYGIRGVGYDVATLTDEISRTLGLTVHRSVALIGVGNLGQALAGYAGFATRGFQIAALVDADPARIGTTIRGLVVQDIADIDADRGRATSIAIAVLAMPGLGRAGRLRRARRGRRHEHPELRPGRADGAARTSTCARSTSPPSCRSCPSTSSARLAAAPHAAGEWRRHERPRRRPVAPHRAGVGARARRGARRRPAQDARRAAPRRDDQRGAAAVDLQPHRGVRRRGAVPPGRRRDHRRCWRGTPASPSPTCPTTSTSTSPRRPPSTCSPSRPGWTRWSSASRRSSASCARPTALGTEAGSVGSVLHDLAQTALRVGKRVHSETGIDRAGASVVSVALDQADARARPARRAARASIVGAGSMGALAGATLRRRGRHRHRRRQPVARARRSGWPTPLGGRAVDARPSSAAEIADADLLVSCTGATGLVVEARHDRRPRATARWSCSTSPCRATSTRSVGEHARRHLRRPRRAARRRRDGQRRRGRAATAIVADELRDYLAEQQQLAVAPTVTALRARANQVIDAELARLDAPAARHRRRSARARSPTRCAARSRRCCTRRPCG